MNWKEKQLELKRRHVGLGASSLKMFELSPKYFKNYVDGNLKEDEATFLALGTKLHMYILEPDEFKKNYIYLEFTRPRGKQEDFCKLIVDSMSEDSNIKDLVIAAYKATYATASKSEDKIKEEALKMYKSLKKYIDYLITAKDYKETLTWGDYNYLRQAKKAAQDHDKAKDMLFDKATDFIDYENDTYTANELMVYWEYPDIEIDGKSLVLRSTFDRLVVDHENKIIQLIDVKTSNDLTIFKDRFNELKYYRQIALYWMAAEYWFKENFPDKDITEYQKESYIAAVQTPNRYRDYPIVWKIFPVSEESVEKGDKEIEELLPKVAWHIIEDKWEHSKEYYDNNGLEDCL